MNLRHWAALQLADPDLLNRARLAYVFGIRGQEALIVTNEDEVYGCGTNVLGCLGFKKKKGHLKPVIIPALNKKNLKGIAASVCQSASFVCAYTVSGELFYWCKNFTPLTDKSIPTSFPTFSKKVSKVACGTDHVSILTTDGQLFSFGSNNYGQLGNGSTHNASIPTLVEGNLSGKIVIKISCGIHFSVCVLDNGKVYAWGANDVGQLGWSPQSHSTLESPTNVPDLSHAFVRKIICGSNYVLAINDCSELISWGCNHVGQLGLKDTTSRHKPTKIDKIGKVVAIAAVEETSAALTENCCVYMWGGCRGLNLNVPEKTQFKSMFEVYAFFSNAGIMYKSMNRLVQLDFARESVVNSFGVTETSDLTIRAEGKEMFVHKFILKLRSRYFESILQKPMVKDDKVIEIDESYDVIYSYINYIYSGTLNATPKIAIELLKIATDYDDLDLKRICEKSIKPGITDENVKTLSNLALKLGATKLAKYCMSFSENNIREVNSKCDEGM